MVAHLNAKVLQPKSHVNAARGNLGVDPGLKSAVTIGTVTKIGDEIVIGRDLAEKTLIAIVVIGIEVIVHDLTESVVARGNEVIVTVVTIVVVVVIVTVVTEIVIEEIIAMSDHQGAIEAALVTEILQASLVMPPPQVVLAETTVSAWLVWVAKSAAP